jgi:DeoR/GlpR family transcriptional regulator of sugar metabolism
MKVANPSMFKNERHSFILKKINLHNKVLSSQLSKELKVSEDTVRRDLAELSEAGEIIKVQGGALSTSYHFPVHQQTVYAQKEKKEIARKAVELISPGMVILTEAGTTMLEMVRSIPDDLEATFFTVSPLMALELAEHPLLKVFLIGGEVDNSAQIVIGEKTISELTDIHVDLCFLGVNALNVKSGLTEVDWKIAQVKKAMIRSASKLAVLSISEKLNSEHKMKVCSTHSIDYLITELKPKDKALAPYRKKLGII